MLEIGIWPSFKICEVNVSIEGANLNYTNLQAIFIIQHRQFLFSDDP